MISAQMRLDHLPWPSHDCTLPLASSGMGCGYASEMISMMPRMAKKLPSVATNDGTRK